MTKQIVSAMCSVTRRNFFSAAAGVIASTAALQSPAADKSLGQMARELHTAIGQFPDESFPTHVQIHADGRSLGLEMEPLRYCSVDEIEDRLRAQFGELS